MVRFEAGEVIKISKGTYKPFHFGTFKHYCGRTQCDIELNNGYEKFVRTVYNTSISKLSKSDRAFVGEKKAKEGASGVTIDKDAWDSMKLKVESLTEQMEDLKVDINRMEK